MSRNNPEPMTTSMAEFRVKWDALARMKAPCPEPPRHGTPMGEPGNPSGEVRHWSKCAGGCEGTGEVFALPALVRPCDYAERFDCPGESCQVCHGTGVSTVEPDLGKLLEALTPVLSEDQALDLSGDIFIGFFKARWSADKVLEHCIEVATGHIEQVREAA